MASAKSLIVDSLRVILPLAIIAGGVGGFIVLGQRKPPPSKKLPPQIPIVQTAVAANHADGLHIEVDGVVVAYREITLAAEVAGKLLEKNELCRAGKYVTEGTPLFKIDPTDYELQVKQLLAEKRQTEANKSEIKVELTNTEELIQLAEQQWTLQQSNLNRTIQLQARNAASATEVETARQSELKARTDLLTLKNQKRLLAVREGRLQRAIDVVDAKYDKAQEDLKRTRIKSPIDGMVVKCTLEEGNHIQNATMLATIEDTSAVEVKCNLRMEELAWLWRQRSEADGNSPNAQRDYQLPKAPVKIIYSLGGREFVWDGVLSRFDGIGLDEKTRTVPCRVLVANPRQVSVMKSKNQNLSFIGPPALVRGMFVTARILAEPQTPLLRIPDAALRPGNVVWRIKNGKLDIVPISVAQMAGEQVVVRGDGEFAAGDHVIVSPLAMATEGMTVREENKQ